MTRGPVQTGGRTTAGSSPALPGCSSQGDNLEEALDNIKEAILGVLNGIPHINRAWPSPIGRKESTPAPGSMSSIILTVFRRGFALPRLVPA
jgi:predicted RNase H-like HicB family nuclease